jgi:hypothetical protein
VVEVVAEEGRCQSRGTGVIVDRAGGKAYVATCQHTLRNRTGRVLVVVGGNRQYEAVVAGEDAKADAAVLVIQDPGVKPLLLAPVPAYGAKTWIGGFSRRVLRFTAGVVRRAIVGVEVTGGALEGWSGGLMIDGQGRLFGILATTDGRTTQGTSIAVFRRLFCQIVPAWREPVKTQPIRPGQTSDLQALLAKITELQTEVATLQAAVEALKSQSCTVGPPGPQGPRGPPGEAGNVDLDALTTKVVARLPPLRFQAKKPDGALHGPVIEKHLGETLYLKSAPVE